MDPRWLDLKLDESADTPLYLQLAAKLAKEINASRWSAGEVLPSERLLSESLSLSRETIRRALEVVQHQGLIHRRHGLGAFISPRLPRLYGFTEMAQAKGCKSESVCLMHQRSTPNVDEAVNLGLAFGDEVSRMKRLRLASGVAMAVDVNCLPVDCLPDPLALGHSLYAYLEQTHHAVVRAVQHIRAINADAELADLVGGKQGDAMLLVARVGYDAQQRAIERSFSYCRQEFFDFFTELQLPSPPEH